MDSPKRNPEIKESITSRSCAHALIRAGSTKLVSVSARVKRAEHVLILTDETIDPRISPAIAAACTELGAIPFESRVLLSAAQGSEPPTAIADAMRCADVIVQATSQVMFYTDAARSACRHGARFLAMTGVTPDVLTSPGLLDTDFVSLEPELQLLARRMTRASSVRISTPAGTDLQLRLDGRSAVENPGFVRGQGEMSGTPNIEAYVAPVEASVEGVAVIDASISRIGLVDEPVRIVCRSGIAAEIEGGRAAERLHALLEAAGTASVLQVAELGIGMNPNARIRGAIIEDEGALGTCHIALGDNHCFGGRNQARLHIDLVMRDPSIWLDDRLVLQGRTLDLKD